MNLNEAQRAAAHRTGQDVCVLAGPGSGKTRVLIERFSWLVREQDVPPQAILAITFTEKAATEVKQRLVKAFEDLPEARAEIERAYVSTIHGFCQRLLKENAIAAGVDPEFRVSDEGEQNTLLRACAERVLDESYAERPELLRRVLRSLPVATAPDLPLPDLAGSLMKAYEAIRTAGADIAEAAAPTETVSGVDALSRAVEEMLDAPIPLKVTQRDALDALREWGRHWLECSSAAGRIEALGGAKWNLNHFKSGSRERETARTIREILAPAAESELITELYAEERTLVVDALLSVDKAYRARKREASVLDFADLEEFAIRLLESNAEILEKIRRSFDHILMDELQDTNPLQWRLADLIRTPGSFFGVGDVNQSIFSFRHADPELFKEYRDSVRENGGAVDDLRENYRSRPEILAAINQVFARGMEGIESRQLESGAAFPPKAAPSVELLGAFGLEAEEIEAAHIASRILELGRPFSEIAILARSYDAMTPICKALEGATIPWIVTGGRSFFETREILDLTDLLRVLANPRDNIALLTVLRSPIVDASDEDLMRLAPDRSLAEGLEQAAEGSRIAAFRDLLHRLRPLRDSMPAERLVRAFTDAAGYEERANPRARSNIDKFCAMLRGYGPLPIPELIRRIETAEPLAEAPPEDIGNIVRIMSMHQAKGLEFPVVFLAAIQRGGRRDSDVISFSSDSGIGMTWRHPVTGLSVNDTAQRLSSPAREARFRAEENRLLYVAMTRAEQHLCLSFATRDGSKRGSQKLILQSLGIAADAADNAVVEHGGVRVHLTNQLPSPAASAAPSAAGTERIALPAPVLREQHDSAASATSVSLFHACPRRYYLSRYLGWTRRDRTPSWDEEPDADAAGELDASAFGDQVHAILAGMQPEAALPEALDLARRFRESPLGQRAAKAARAEREWDFLFAIEDVVVRGQIDLWFEDRGGIAIVDYKTDEVAGPVTRERARAYEIQLQLYALALSQFLGRNPSAAHLHFLRPDEVVEVNLSPLHLNAARASVREFREAQDRGEYPVRPGAQCYRCEFFAGLCPVKRVEVSGPPASSFAEPPSAVI